MAGYRAPISLGEQALRSEQERRAAAEQKARDDKAAWDASLLRQERDRAQQSLRAVHQTVGPGGGTTTQYGLPEGAGSGGGSMGSRSTSGGSGGGASDGISEYELQRIMSITGAGKQPEVSRGNIAGEQAARDAAFARAKEQSGAVARSSLAALRNQLGRRGITGGGYAQMRGAEALAPATDQLQDFTRQQLIEDLGQSRHVADTEYQGQIAQRGQNQAAMQSLLGLIRSRGKLY